MAASSSLIGFIKGVVIAVDGDVGRICGENSRFYTFNSPNQEHLSNTFAFGDKVVFYASAEMDGNGVYLARMVNKNAAEVMNSLGIESAGPSANPFQLVEPIAAYIVLCTHYFIALHCSSTPIPVSAAAAGEKMCVVYGFVEKWDQSTRKMTVFCRSLGRGTFFSDQTVCAGCWISFKYFQDKAFDVEEPDRPETFISVKFTSRLGIAFRGIGICGHNLLQGGGSMWSDELGWLDVPRDAMREVQKKHPNFKSLLNLVKFLAYSRNGSAWAVESVNIMAYAEMTNSNKWPMDCQVVSDVVVGNQIGGQLIVHSAQLNANISVDRANFGSGSAGERLVAAVVPTPNGGLRALFCASKNFFTNQVDNGVLAQFVTNQKALSSVPMTQSVMGAQSSDCGFDAMSIASRTARELSTGGSASYGSYDQGHGYRLFNQ